MQAGFFLLKTKALEGGNRMQPLVGVIMGSTSDWETMKNACDILEELDVPYEKRSFPLTGRLT